jgi:hypothetical protein
MRVELKHHYGWCEYEIAGAESIEDAAYKAVRQSHKFLRAKNHTYSIGEMKTTWGGRDIRWTSVLVFRGKGAPAYTGPKWADTSYWFAVEYRDPTAMNPEADNG